MDCQINSSRRQFIRLLACGTTSVLTGTSLITEQVCADIGVEFASSVGTLRLRLSDYPALAQAQGSIRIGINPLRSNHQPDGTFHPILVNRLENDELIAMSAECTHASCAVRTYSTSAGSHICPCHGSRFSLDGRRLAGPAPFDLDRYSSTVIDNELLEIQVPRLGFNVNGCLEKSGASSRLKLEFPARRSVTYQVIKKDRINGEWARAAFALSVSGTIDQMELKGSDSIASIYVPSILEQGFYAIEVKADTV